VQLGRLDAVRLLRGADRQLVERIKLRRELVRVRVRLPHPLLPAAQERLVVALPAAQRRRRDTNPLGELLHRLAGGTVPAQPLQEQLLLLGQLDLAVRPELPGRRVGRHQSSAGSSYERIVRACGESESVRNERTPYACTGTSG